MTPHTLAAGAEATGKVDTAGCVSTFCSVQCPAGQPVRPIPIKVLGRIPFSKAHVHIEVDDGAVLDHMQQAPT